MKRDRPIYWNETAYLVRMGTLQRFAERNVNGNPTVADLVRMARDPHSVQAIQRRDRIAAYLGIEPWEWKDQL